MSATDPLREALTTLLSEIAGSVGLLRVVTEGMEARHDADLIAAAMGRARSALAAVPAEPEAWEWRVCYGNRLGEHPGEQHTATSERQAFALAAERGDWLYGWVERGRWERVNPEPREEGT